MKKILSNVTATLLISSVVLCSISKSAEASNDDKKFKPLVQTCPNDPLIMTIVCGKGDETCTEGNECPPNDDNE